MLPGCVHVKMKPVANTGIVTAAVSSLLGNGLYGIAWPETGRHMHLIPVHVDALAHRFSHVHVDLMGPLPASRGDTSARYSQLLTETLTFIKHFC
jgi:hypothetical protein